MIPLAQYLNDRDNDAGSRTFAPRRPKRASQRQAEFHTVGGERPASVEPQAFERIGGQEAGRSDQTATESGKGADTVTLFKDMEGELRRRAAPAAPAHDARAMQEDLKSKAGRFNSGNALENALKVAYEQGRTEALAEANADRDAAIESAIEAEREVGKVRLAEATQAVRAEWVEIEGRRLADALCEQMDQLVENLRMSLSGVLLPLAVNTRQRQSVEEIVEAIESLTFDGQAMAMKATGPADLLEAIESALGDKATLMRFQPSEDKADVKIEIGQSVLETRLGEWRTALEQALS